MRKFTRRIWFNFSWILVLYFDFSLKTNIVETSSLKSFVDSNSRSNGNHSAILYSVRNVHERFKRASLSETFDGQNRGDSPSSELFDIFSQNVRLILGFTIVFCLSSIVLAMCIFCYDDKSSDVEGPNGYVGEINLADIQVIYNPSSGAPRLPYTHQNEAFRSSQEDIVLGNPAILQVSACDGVDVRPSNVPKTTALNQNVVSGEVKSNAMSRRLKDVYVERGNVIKLEYENPYTAGYRSGPSENKTKKTYAQPENGRGNTNTPQSSTVLNNPVFNRDASQIYRDYDGIRDYDMNDLTIKNMNVRY